MANRYFENAGFWDRVDIAIKASGMSKAQLANKLGVERKSMYRREGSSWHSGRIAAFCKLVGVSADWLLGITDCNNVGSPRRELMQFKVINKKTGKEPIFDHNHLFREKWFKDSNLIYCDIEGWYIGEDGTLILADECGNLAYPPRDKYEVVFI